jgi:hypothetical protein
MQVHFDIPEDLASRIAPTSRQLNRVGLEAFVLEHIRSGKLTVAQARPLLGIDDRFEMDGFLKARGVFQETKPDEIEADMASARRFLK